MEKTDMVEKWVSAVYYTQEAQGRGNGGEQQWGECYHLFFSLFCLPLFQILQVSIWMRAANASVIQKFSPNFAGLNCSISQRRRKMWQRALWFLHWGLSTPSEIKNIVTLYKIQKHGIPKSSLMFAFQPFLTKGFLKAAFNIKEQLIDSRPYRLWTLCSSPTTQVTCLLSHSLSHTPLLQ